MVARWLHRAFDVGEDEAGAVVAGFAMFLLLFAGYFMLRPVRETMGIAGGVDNLQWLFTGTFVATLAAMPLFGWIAGRVQRRRILYWVYGFFAANLVLFAACFALRPDDPWIARAFYIWLSAFNMIAISVAWSVLVDVFTAAQSRRLFALMAAGASLGGLVGPMLGIVLVGPLGHPGLLLLSAALLAAAAFAAWCVHRWRDAALLRVGPARRPPLSRGRWPPGAGRAAARRAGAGRRRRGGGRAARPAPRRPPSGGSMRPPVARPGGPDHR